MKKYNFRFVNDPKNQNVGLTVEEINFLQKESNLKFPEVYVSYLQNAGKNSNVFHVETDSEKLRKIQNELRSELDKLNILQNENILCIKKYEVYEEYFNSNFETYYFFNISENKWNPTLYIFEEVCINEGWLAFKKQIRETKENDFIAFINYETERKYGLTLRQHIKNIPLYIISIPLSLILLIILGFQILKEKFLNK
jgi:hypothetical protein